MSARVAEAVTAVPADRGSDVRAFVVHVWASALLGLALSLASAAWIPGPVGASLGVGQGLLCCLALLVRRPSPWLARIVLCGLVAGVVELAADAWLVEGPRALVYPRSGAFLLDSPPYMPAAWMGMLCFGMASGLVLRRWLGRLGASLTVAGILGIYLPLYEALARMAGWWIYRGPTLILDAVPPYVMLGELLLALPLVALVERLERAGTLEAVALGVAQGLWILLSYVLAWAICPG